MTGATEGVVLAMSGVTELTDDITDSADDTCDATDEAADCADDRAAVIEATSDEEAVSATDCNELATDRIELACELA